MFLNKLKWDICDIFYIWCLGFIVVVFYESFEWENRNIVRIDVGIVKIEYGMYVSVL